MAVLSLDICLMFTLLHELITRIYRAYILLVVELSGVGSKSNMAPVVVFFDDLAGFFC